MARNACPTYSIEVTFSPSIGSQLTAKKPRPKPGPNCLRSFSGFALVRPGAVRPDRLAVRPFRAPAVAGLASVGRRRPAVGPACPGPDGRSRSRAAKEKPSELLRHSLARLSPKHGEVIDLVYFRGKSVTEVAEIVGIAEATVKTRMFLRAQEVGGVHC